MTPAEFIASKRWMSCHFSTATYKTLTDLPSELVNPVTTSVEVFKPTGLDWEAWFDSALQIGAEGVVLTTKHWDGFCLWPSETSTRNIGSTTWSTIFGVADVLAEWVRLARAYGMRVGFYFCVRDLFYEMGGQSETYTEWTIALLTELLNGDYGDIDLLVLDGWGTTWAPVTFTAVDYDDVMSAIANLSDCLVAINDHEDENATNVHGDVSLWERPIDGEPPAGITNFDSVLLWDPVSNDSQVGGNPGWFQHTDSLADTLGLAQYSIGRQFRARNNGYVNMPNISIAPLGDMASGTLETIRGLRAHSTSNPSMVERFALALNETAPITLQTHADWTRLYGSVSMTISPAGRAWINSGTGATYAFNQATYLDALVQLDFQFASIPTNCTIAAMIRCNDSETNYDRIAFVKTGSTIGIYLDVKNTTLATVSQTSLALDLLTDTPYRLTIQKIGNELQGSLWWEVDGAMELWGRLFATSSTNSTAGRAAFYMSSSGSSATTGAHATAFRVFENATNTPLSPNLIPAYDGSRGSYLQIRKLDDAKYTKLWRSEDNGVSWKIVGVTESHEWADGDAEPGTNYRYRATSINDAWLESGYSGIVDQTYTEAVQTGDAYDLALTATGQLVDVLAAVGAPTGSPAETLSTITEAIKTAIGTPAGDDVTTVLDLVNAKTTNLPSQPAAAGGNALISTTIATLASQTSFTLTAGSADNDAYRRCIAVITDQSTSTQKAVCLISGYTGSTKTVTLAKSPVFTIATGDFVAILPDATQGEVSPFLPMKTHSWKFDNASQVIAPNIIYEVTGFDDLLIEMDLCGVLDSSASISTIGTVTVEDVALSTEPTVVSATKRADQRAIIIKMDGASATATTYTVSVTFTTTDSQTLTRKGRLIIQ